MSHSVLLAIAILISLAYVALGIAAYQHVKKDEIDHRNGSALLPLTLWWPFYRDLYEERGQRLRRLGMVLLPFGVAAYVAYFSWR